MRPRLGLFALLASAAGLAAPAGAQDVPPALVYFELVKGACPWHLHDPVSGTDVVFHETAYCPVWAIWDAPRRRTVYLQDDEILALPWHRGARPVRIGRLDLPQAENWYDGAVSVTDDGAIRVARMTRIDPEIVIPGPDFAVRVDWEGRTYEGYDWGWGLPAVVTVQEMLPRAAGWREVDAMLTWTDAGDTPGIHAAAESLAQGRGVTAVHTAYENGRYQLFDHMPFGDGGYDTPEWRALLELVPGTPWGDPPDDILSVPVGPGFLLTPVIWGDSGHPYAGYRWCADAVCTRPGAAFDPPHPAALGADGPWFALPMPRGDLVLITDNATIHPLALVYRYGETDPLANIPTAIAALWLPDPAIWEAFGPPR